MRTRRTRTPLLFVLLLAGTLASASVAANAVGAAGLDQTREDRDWKTTERDLRLVHHPGGFSWTSRLDTTDANDTIEGAYNAGDDRLTFSMKSTPEGGPDPTSNELTVDFLSLIEFDDQDEDGHYDVGERVHQRIHFSELDRPAVSASPYYGDGHRVVVSYILPYPANDDGFPVGGGQPTEGALRLVFFVLPEVRSVDGTVVHPTEAKLNVVIDAFPYAHNTSALAMHTRIDATAGLAPSGNAIVSKQDMTGLAFDWNGEVHADHAEAAVGATTLGNDDGTYDMVLAYLHAQLIQHDPTVSAHRYEPTSIFKGIQEALTKGDPFVYVVGIALATAVVGGVTVHRLRRAD